MTKHSVRVRSQHRKDERGDVRRTMFADRIQAGKQLAHALETKRILDPIVLALPRGGVPVAFEVARALHAPMDVLIVRKLASRHNPEFGFGAVGEFGVYVVDERTQSRLGIDDAELEHLITAQQAEVNRRIQAYRNARPMMDITNRNVIIVDDGLATGSTARAAALTARRLGPKSITLAVPTGSQPAVRDLTEYVDDVVCLESPTWFGAVGDQYEHFMQISDGEVNGWLREAAMENSLDDPVDTIDVEIPVSEHVRLPGQLRIPDHPRALVVFAHGSGSSRFSTRNQFVARRMEQSGFATLLFDLLTESEGQSPAFVFNIELLAERLNATARWLGRQEAVRDLELCLFGASTGAAAALIAAAEHPLYSSIVSRGGRPDLADGYLARVDAPTLLIVGGADDVVMTLNHQAQRQLHCESRLETIAGATHLFAEEGALEAVASLAVEWFAAHLHARV